MPERQRAFVAALAASGVVTQAAREIGASLEALYKLRHRKGGGGPCRGLGSGDRSRGGATGRLRAEAVRSGEVVASWRHYDTPLLLFLLY